MSAQSKGRYAEALQNYYEALQVEEDPYDRSYTLYNIGLIYGNGSSINPTLQHTNDSGGIIEKNVAKTLYFENVSASTTQTSIPTQNFNEAT